MAFDATDFEVQTITRPELRDFRERLAKIDPALFDMHVPHPSVCGTPACFHGWVQTFYFDGQHSGLERSAACLGLTEGQARDLYQMGSSDTCIRRVVDAGVDPFAATLEQGLRVLDHLIATGEVDWSVARKAEA